MAKRLSEKQLRFIELWTGNATETATLAGYSNAKDAGTRCLKNSEICRAIKEKRSKEIKPLIATRQDRQKFWTDVMMDAEEDMKNRLKSSELLGKSEGDFLDRMQLSGDHSNPIVHRPAAEEMAERGIPIPEIKIPDVDHGNL